MERDELMDDKKIKAFLKELTELSKWHGIVIGGCGCCGSPFLMDIERANKSSKKKRGCRYRRYSKEYGISGDIGWG